MKPGDTLAHYRVIERVGGGGMGEVYRAEDIRLRRIVALKMLRADLEKSHASARLLAEARAASALTHPNIAVVYETSEAEHDGRHVGYIAMEYVDGRTVADLAGGGLLDLDRVLDIAGQIADALADAHAQGLVHRDLKPSNVMVTPVGRVKVLDFGVAQRQPPAPAAPDDETRTAELPTGLATFVGTLPYAAPEQATGRAVDARADIFSFGVMLYELASGQRPFGGDNPAQMLEAMLRDEPPRFNDTARDPRLLDLEPLVRRMLARDPRRRPGTAAEIRAALDAVRNGKTAAERRARALNGAANGEARSVAVASFTNISGDPEDDWLGAGLAETLTVDAGQLEGIEVFARARIAAAARAIGDQTGETDDALFTRAARELGARWIVTGGFQRSRDAIRVTASLTDLTTGQLLVTTKVDGSLSAIFEVQDRLVQELARTLRTVVAPEASPSPGTRVVDAYEAFSRGLLNRSAESFESLESLDRAVWFFESAVARDPAYARAHIELGVAYGSKGDYLSLPELYDRATASLRRAIELDPSSARAWRELGIELLSGGHADEGLAAIQHALALDPDDAASIGSMGRSLFIGYARFAEAAEWFDRAFAANPKGGWYALQRAHIAALMRDFAAGQQAVDNAIALQEAILSGHEGLFIAGAYIRAGHLAALQGRHGEAVKLFEREIDFLTRTEHPLRHRILVELNVRLGASYQELGDRRKADALLGNALESFERRVRLGADDPFTRYYAAGAHAMRGDGEAAIAFLKRAASQHRAFTFARARVEPEFDRIRKDPRFLALVGDIIGPSVKSPEVP
jgi:TolB-like protein/tetratricopeptide (TPR) repeat protein